MSEPEIKKVHRKSKRHKISLLREFSVEIFIALIFLFGLFLLFEKMEIKSVVFQGVVSFFQAISHWLSHLFAMLLGRMGEFETSDIVGTILIVIAFILLSVRVRAKAIYRLSELPSCPECDGDLILVHRNLYQRIVGKIFWLKIRRYKCKSCDFDGLRLRSKNSR